MVRLTKTEWEEKVRQGLANTSLGPVSEDAIKSIWWIYVNHVQTEGMRLSSLGFNWFNHAGIEFSKHDVTLNQWSAALTLGLSRMPSPYYLHQNKKNTREYEFYIFDDEYAMLLMFMSGDLLTFAKTFLHVV